MLGSHFSPRLLTLAKLPEQKQTSTSVEAGLSRLNFDFKALTSSEHEGNLKASARWGSERGPGAAETAASPWQSCAVLHCFVLLTSWTQVALKDYCKALLFQIALPSARRLLTKPRRLLSRSSRTSWLRAAAYECMKISDFSHFLTWMESFHSF